VALCAFVIEIFSIFAILPLGHTLTVMPASRTPAYAIGIADVDSSDMLLYTKAHHPPNAFMAQVAHLPFRASAHLAPSALQLAQPRGPSLAACAFSCNRAKRLIAATFDRADATAGNDER
jgi:hypothetical protein